MFPRTRKSAFLNEMRQNSVNFGPKFSPTVQNFPQVRLRVLETLLLTTLDLAFLNSVWLEYFSIHSLCCRCSENYKRDGTF